MAVGPVVRDAETAEFFEGTAKDLFILRTCDAGHHSSPYARQCDTCGDTELRPTPASGDATVVSWAIVPARPTQSDPGKPTVLVVAELAEGPWWWSHITDADPDSVTVGTPLRIAFERHSDQHEAVPVFVLN